MCQKNVWNLQSADVVCRQLGFKDALAAPICSSFGQGKGIIWLSNVDCRGNESSLAQCRHGSWGYSRCDHHREDVGVVCRPQGNMMYRIFSIKRPRRLFQNWRCGPGVYLKPALNRGPAFIYEVQLHFFSDKFIITHPPTPRAVSQRRTSFLFIPPWQTVPESLGIIITKNNSVIYST